MTDASFDRMMQAARTGRLSRRDVLERGLKLGMSTAAISALMAAAPEVGAAPRPRSLHNLPDARHNHRHIHDAAGRRGARSRPPLPVQQRQRRHSAATTEMLIQYKGESTFDYEPMLAESWEASADNSTYTFKIFPNVTFHDGDPCTSAEVKASFDRLLHDELSAAGERRQSLRPRPGHARGRRRSDGPLQPRQAATAVPCRAGIQLRPVHHQPEICRGAQDRRRSRGRTSTTCRVPSALAVQAG